jgi:GNAT superfamily N-acetyltransferase
LYRLSGTKDRAGIPAATPGARPWKNARLESGGGHLVRTVREIPGGVEPVPYPEGDASDAALKDGTRVHLRPIRGDEGPRLLELYDRLSSESLYFRFFAVPDKDRAKANYLAHVDYVNRYALVAEIDGAIIGVARWERDLANPARAEVAFTVADALQGRGLGSLLFRRLATLARARGIATFDADVLPSNEKMLRVFERSGLAQTSRRESPALKVSLALGPEPAA